nr:MAG TPA: hypothetical protein [Caudoviricetes sp.]
MSNAFRSRICRSFNFSFNTSASQDFISTPHSKITRKNTDPCFNSVCCLPSPAAAFQAACAAEVEL